MAEVTGTVTAAVQAVSIRATVARAKAPVQPGGNQPGNQPGGQPGGNQPGGQPGNQPGNQPGGGNQPGTTTPNALVSFKLKFVHQDERKSIRLIYDRKQAVRRSYAPQGFIGLLLDQLPDKSKHFTLVDLRDLFFEKLHVDVNTPADFARIGLFSTDVAIDYGDPADAQNHHHDEFRLTATDRGPKSFDILPQPHARSRLPGRRAAPLRPQFGLDRREAQLRDPGPAKPRPHAQHRPVERPRLPGARGLSQSDRRGHRGRHRRPADLRRRGRIPALGRAAGEAGQRTPALAPPADAGPATGSGPRTSRII